MLAFEAAAKSCGAIYCGISSTGPSMFGIMPDADNAHAFKKEIETNFSEYFELATIGPAGQALMVGENH